MECHRCKTESRDIDYIQVFYQNWICTACLLARAMRFVGKEAEGQNRQRDDDGMRGVEI